jgi:hypothetical protein
MRKLLLALVLLLFACGSAMAIGGIVGSPISGGTSTTLSSGAVTTTEILDGTIAGADLNPAIVILTTGTINGAVKILDNVSGPTAAQSYGSLNVVNANITVLLPTAVAGMSMCVVDLGTAHDIIIDVQATDNIALLGATDTNGDGITNASGASTGDFACVVAYAANKWLVMQRQGTWAQQ